MHVFYIFVKKKNKYLNEYVPFVRARFRSLPSLTSSSRRGTNNNNEQASADMGAVAKAERRKVHKKQNEKKCCSFTGVLSTRERRLRAPCAAGRGESRRLMVRCERCVNSRTKWICLACWDGIAEKTQSLVASRSKTHRLMQHRVYEALCGGIDFAQLRADAETGGDAEVGTTVGGGLLKKHLRGEWEWQARVDRRRR